MPKKLLDILRLKHDPLRQNSLGGIGTDPQPRSIHSPEMIPADAIQQMPHLVIPAFVGRAGNVPIRAVIGQEDAIDLHGAQYDLQLRRVSGNIE